MNTAILVFIYLSTANSVLIYSSTAISVCIYSRTANSVCIYSIYCKCSIFFTKVLQIQYLRKYCKFSIHLLEYCKFDLTVQRVSTPVAVFVCHVQEVSKKREEKQNQVQEKYKNKATGLKVEKLNPSDEK